MASGGGPATDGDCMIAKVNLFDYHLRFLFPLKDLHVIFAKWLPSLVSNGGNKGDAASWPPLLQMGLQRWKELLATSPAAEEDEEAAIAAGAVTRRAAATGLLKAERQEILDHIMMVWFKLCTTVSRTRTPSPLLPAAITFLSASPQILWLLNKFGDNLFHHLALRGGRAPVRQFTAELLQALQQNLEFRPSDMRTLLTSENQDGSTPIDNAQYNPEMAALLLAAAGERVERAGGGDGATADR